MKRQPQILLIAATLAFSWLAMQAVHELGHVAAAIVTGGHLKAVILHPTRLSYTQLSTNPHPLFVAWAGPLIGIVLPLAAFALARFCRLRSSYLFQFFAGFCLIANGAYLAFGSFHGVGDAGDIVRYGSPLWLLWLFGVITIPLGLAMWNRLGPHFGLGPSLGQVDRRDAYAMCVLLAVTIVCELFLSPAAVRI